MSPQELEGIGTAVSRAIGEACALLRSEQSQVIDGMRRESEQVTRSLEQRCDRAEARADRAEAQVGALQRELEAVRELASAPALKDGVIDSAGALRLVQRNGDTLAVRMADLPALIVAAVADRFVGVEQRLTERQDEQVTRALQRLGDAPKWDRTAVYRDGAVVACYSGRTYVLRDGKASMGQEPGEHPELWQRIGSHGLRALKAKPEHPEPGDLYAEGDSRFLYDGEATTLLVPRALKQSDLERMVRPLQVELRVLAELAGGLRRDVDEVRPVVQRAAQDANASRAWCDSRKATIDSPALARILERINELDELLNTLLGKKDD